MRNESLNNTCILFDKDNIAQQKAIIRFYNDNGWYADIKDNLNTNQGEFCIGVYGDLGLGAWWNTHDKMRIIDLPKEYYPIEQSTLLLTENNGKTKPYVVVDEKGGIGFVTPIVEQLENISKCELDGNGLIVPIVESESKEIDYQELWDEFSEYVDDDIDSLQAIAGTTIMSKYRFYKLIEKITRK